MKCLGEGGFTLLNALLELLVLMIFLPLIVLFFGFMIRFSAEADAQTAEWHLFAVDLQSYLQGIESIEVINNGGGVRIVREAEEYDIELYDRFLRKQKFRQGHEVMLTDIRDCRFIINGNKLALRAEMANGTVEQAEYVFTHPKGQ
jgi:competence protein ComGF